MQEKFDRAHRLRLDLMTALENEKLYLAFHPIIRTSDGVIIGAEALLRWRHPTHGLISSRKFIPIAEDIRGDGNGVMFRPNFPAQGRLRETTPLT